MTGPRRLSMFRNRPPAAADGRMSLVEHLFELRTRLFRAALAILVTSVVAYVFFDPIFNFLTGPYCALPADKRGGGSQCQLYTFSVLGEFNVRIRVAILVGIVASAPVWLYQLWRFVTPGLHRHERRWTLSFVSIATVLFGVGTVLAYYTLTTGLSILLRIAGNRVDNLLDVNGYLGYVVATLLIFGFSFEFPLLVVMLNMVGVVSHKKLASWRRQMIFFLFVFAAIATPSQDPISLMFMAIPMVLLYEAALVFTRIHDRNKGKRELEAGVGEIGDDEISQIDERPSDLSDIS
ncbi:MAG: twin-arginine translocase subunit TatC [Mycobacteriales bacterium]